jgi:hypothetical protein
MNKAVLIGVRSHFMKIIHIELSKISYTCLTKDEYLLCLKYFGKITLENKVSSMTINPTPVVVHLTIESFPSS